MQILILAVSDRGFCLGVDTEDDLYIFRPTESREFAIGSVVDVDTETGLLFCVEPATEGQVPSLNTDGRDRLLGAIAALIGLGQPRQILTRHKLFATGSPDLVDEIAAALHNDL